MYTKSYSLVESREKIMSTTKKTTTKVTIKKDAENKITNESFTEEELALLQEDAQQRSAKFVEAFKTATAKRKDVVVTSASSDNNLTIHTANKATAEVCRKDKYTVVYTCRCTDTKERDAILKLFKDTEDIHTCKTAKYLTSNEKRIEIIFADNKVSKAFIDSIVATCNSIKASRDNYKKQLKKAQ